MANTTKASRLRQRLVQTASRYAAIAEAVVSERGPLVRGFFHLHGHTCGKDNCRCARGELHSTAVLAVSEQGKQRNIYVRPADRPTVKGQAEGYRRLRKRRAELSKVHKEVLALADELLAALLIPYEPEPEPEPRRRAVEDDPKEPTRGG